MIRLLFMVSLLATCMQCSSRTKRHYTIYETSANGRKMDTLQLDSKNISSDVKIRIQSTNYRQSIVGFGGAFTQSTCHLLQHMDAAKRNDILNAYFSDSGAAYSLTRTTINSCDFSLGHYAYAETKDSILSNFSIERDKEDIIPIILQAKSISKQGFKIIASPWTAPPWMKDNNAWVGGKLLPEYHGTWALYFSKYLHAYKKEGIDIWGFTVENEPMGNGNNWESMHFTPREMSDFVVHHLKPKLIADGWGDIKILGFDQNRYDLPEWVDAMYDDKKTFDSFDGVAIHWYESTFDYFPKQLQYAHKKAPNKLIIQTEACVDAEVPQWQNDTWYWSEEATDWGFEWATADKKDLHPKYVPVFRYARDIIGCINNHVNGWIDWNMVLDRQGGPNWFKNWCIAPVIVDTSTQEIYYTPLYHTLTHFSKFIRPDALVLELTTTDDSIMVLSVRNPDDSVIVVVLNPEKTKKSIDIIIDKEHYFTTIDGQAIQTIQITN